MSKRLQHAIVTISLAILASACGDHASTTTQTDSPAPEHKRKHTQILLTDIQGNPASQAVTVEQGTDKQAVVSGDTLRPGDILRTAEGADAELRFGSGTLALLHENSAVKLGISPEVSQLNGQLTISRKPGAPLPFVFDINGQQFSVINGKTTVETQGDQTVVAVISGEILRLGDEKYFSGGEQLYLPTAAPPKGKNVHRLGPTVPHIPESQWAPSISPLDTASAVALGNPIRRGIGTLTARNPRTDKTTQNAMKMDRHVVNVTIREGVAVTEVEEAFTNQSNVTVEATYRFLVPSTAHITRLALDVNGRIEEGEVLEKKRAARIFKQIVDDSIRPKDPALLEWEQGAAFKIKIFPIKPKETRRVFITYTTPLLFNSGYAKYEYPLSSPAGAAEMDTFSIQADIQTATPIRAVKTPLFNAQSEQHDTSAKIAFSAQHHAPQNNFVITIETVPQESPLRTLVQTEKNGESFGMFIWHPDGSASPVPAAGRHILAMIDTSYRTEQSLIELEAATLIEMLGGLGHEDRFNVLACDSSCRPVYEDYVEPTAARLIDVYEKIHAIEPGGSSNLLGNFSQTFLMAPQPAPVDVVYLGDGIATSGELNNRKLLQQLEHIRPAGVRVHTVGIGPNIDAAMLRRLASHLGGANYNLSFGESPGNASWQLAKMFSRDALTNISIEANDDAGRAIALSPRRAGFLPSGQALAFYARLDNLPATAPSNAQIHISAIKSDGSHFEQTYRVQLSASAPAPGVVSRLWAGEQIETLQFEDGDASSIIDLSRKYRIASRLTSWIVLENQRMYDIFDVQRTDGEQAVAEPGDFTDADVEVTDSEDAESESDKAFAAPQLRQASRAASASPKKRSAKASGVSAADPLTVMDGASPRSSESIKSMQGPTIRPREYPSCSKPRYQIDISAFSISGGGGEEKATSIQQQLSAHPLSRSLHRRYVRQLAKMTTRDRALEAANNWRAVDPYSTTALRASAAEVARGGHRQRAIRLYDAQTEIAADSIQTHRRLAQMQRTIGDHNAAAGHFKAILSLSAKADFNDVIDYLFELILSGQHALFELEADAVPALNLGRTQTQQLEALRESIHTGIVPERNLAVQKGPLSISVSASADVDIHLVDPYGRVSSGLWPFGAEVDAFSTQTEERFYAQASLQGGYKVVITRPTPSASPITGTATIRFKGKQKNIPFQLTGNEQIVAKISYQRLPDKRCYATEY
ncbi:MAG: FecR domain-containing protein [Deltaproteobacteria bacterium]|nr:FecR domain-containing protein [Deltaproteobacteria bacterium]MBN2674485.1 FecR domain-containing protein [Deltaproteobacteria bacterium]